MAPGLVADVRCSERERLARVVEGAEEELDEADLESADTLLPPRAADAALLARALAALPDATRSVLWLYHAEGYTHDEIAGLTGKTISFSKSQLARGTRRLRALLEIEPEVTAHA